MKRQLKTQKVLTEAWPNSQINGKAKYPSRQNNALYLVENAQPTLKLGEKLPKPHRVYEFRDQTRGNHFPSCNRSGSCWNTVSKEFRPQQLESFASPDLQLRPCTWWLPLVRAVDESSHWNVVHIRIGYQNFSWYILDRKAGAALFNFSQKCNSKIIFAVSISPPQRPALEAFVQCYTYILL